MVPCFKNLTDLNHFHHHRSTDLQYNTTSQNTASRQREKVKLISGTRLSHSNQMEILVQQVKLLHFQLFSTVRCSQMAQSFIIADSENDSVINSPESIQSGLVDSCWCLAACFNSCLDSYNCDDCRSVSSLTGPRSQVGPGLRSLSSPPTANRQRQLNNTLINMGYRREAKTKLIQVSKYFLQVEPSHTSHIPLPTVQPKETTNQERRAPIVKFKRL